MYVFKEKLMEGNNGIRLAKGASLMSVDFDESEGNLWDEDSKGAVEYACQLMGEYLPTTFPIKIFARRPSTSPVGNNLALTTSRIFYNSNDMSVGVPISIEPAEIRYKVPSASLKKMAVSNGS